MVVPQCKVRSKPLLLDSIPVVLDNESFAAELADESIDREALLDFMKERGIGCAPGIWPIHLQPAYAEKHSNDRLPQTLRAARRSFFLPLYPGMADDEQEFVLSALKEALVELSTEKETR